MIPAGGSLGTQRLEVVEQPSRTWRLNMERGRVTGLIDGLEAVRQAVFKMLHTERFRHLIYDANYGTEWIGLIGQDPVFVRSELRRRITEALTQDDRIDDVTDYAFDFSGENAVVHFTVVSTFGTFREGVTLHV